MWGHNNRLLSSYDGRVSSSQYIQIISKMIFDEPTVYSMIMNQQCRSLKHGIIVRWGHTPPTPSFQEHLQKYYLPFCRDAILLFLAVGFVPFRIRQEGHTQIPEALPLGTFSWSVCGSDSKHRKKRSKTTQSKKTDDTYFHVSPNHHGLSHQHSSKGGGGGLPDTHEPLLVYDVTCPYCKEDIHIFNYVQPHAMLDCFSPLASLIPQYNALCSVRELTLRTTENNSHYSFAIEEQDKTMLNSVADTGACISRMPNHLAQGIYAAEQDQRQHSVTAAVEIGKNQNQLPFNARAFVVPKNNTVKPLDKPTPLPDLHEREAAFARSVAMVLGLPASGAQMSSTSSNGSKSQGGWNDSPEMFSRTTLDSCMKINHALQRLLQMAYTLIYNQKSSSSDDGAEASKRKIPSFYIPLAPNLPYDLLLPLFDAQVLDDLAYSRIFEASTGFPLGERAIKAREDRHKALTVLPPPPLLATAGNASKK